MSVSFGFTRGKLIVAPVRALCYKLPPDFHLDGILGLDFLKHFNITIDHGSETVSMEKWAE